VRTASTWMKSIKLHITKNRVILTVVTRWVMTRFHICRSVLVALSDSHKNNRSIIPQNRMQKNMHTTSRNIGGYRFSVPSATYFGDPLSVHSRIDAPGHRVYCSVGKWSRFEPAISRSQVHHIPPTASCASCKQVQDEYNFGVFVLVLVGDVVWDRRS